MTHPITLPEGCYPQIYRAKLDGDTHAARMAMLDAALSELAALGCPGVAFHGFSQELPAAWDELAALAAKHGLLALAAFGLDDTDPAGKGDRIASVAVKPSCAAVLFDAEGRWEDDPDDKAKAREMAANFRAKAPNVPVFDQPWPVPTLHWSAFPWDEFADLCDARAPQFYVNDFAGRWGSARYKQAWSWFEGAWAKLNERLARTGRVESLVPTIQGYGWADILPDLIDCLCRNPRLFLWCEPLPAPETKRALRAVQALKAAGFTGPDAVRSFQASRGLVSDGIAGTKSLAALGV